MANKKTTKVISHVLELSDRELALIESGLNLIHDFGDMNDWDDARNLLSDLNQGD